MARDDQEEKIERIARMCYATNRNWCRENGDFSQPRWRDAAEWQRRSFIEGVKFHIANPDASASASHDEWSRVKYADGWTHGPEKDVDKKTHPCLVPFEELPWNQKVKDHLFKATVHAILDA